MARENRTWGYDRIQGALKHLGYSISDQTVGNILKRYGIPLAARDLKAQIDAALASLRASGRLAELNARFGL